MSSTYNGSGTTIHTSAALLDDSDRPAAILWRVPEEAIFDSLAAIATALGGTDVSSITAITSAGGTFPLASALRFLGSAVEFAANVTIESTGELIVESGGELSVASGGLATVDIGGALVINGEAYVVGALYVTAAGVLDVQGAIAVGAVAGTPGIDSIVLGNGAEITMQSGSDLDVEAGAAIDIESGGALNVESGGAITLTAAQAIAITEAGFFRLTLGSAWVQGGDDVNWGRLQPTPAEGWFMRNTSSAFSILFPLTLPPGDVLNSITVTIEGNAGGIGHAGTLPANLPVVRLEQVDLNGVTTTVDSGGFAQVTDPSASAAAYDAAHAVTLTLGSPLTLSASNVYYIRVFSETGANSVADTTAIRSIYGSVGARSFRGTSGTVVLP